MYIVTEVEGATVGIREGWNGGKRLRNTRRLDVARQAFLLFTSISPPDILCFHMCISSFFSLIRSSQLTEVWKALL